jgi:hypothetical protein
MTQATLIQRAQLIDAMTGAHRWERTASGQNPPNW